MAIIYKKFHLRSLFRLSAVVAISGICLAGNTVFGQDSHFSQFYATPLTNNPAFAGISYGPRIIFNYRNQWPSLTNAFVTYAVSYDQHFNGINGGIGLSVLSDRAGNGMYSSTSINAMYSYKLSLNKEFAIKASLQAIFTQKKLDWNNVLLPDMINFLDINKPFDTQEPSPGTTSLTLFDFGGGFILYSTNFFIGGAAKHILQPTTTFYDDNSAITPMFIIGHIGGTIKLSNVKKERFYMAPNAAFSMQGEYKMVNVGSIMNRKSFFGGLSLRHAFKNTDALIFLVGLSKGILKIGYSYDVTLSGLSNGSGGAHEISLVLNFAEKGDNWRTMQNKVPIPSPVFF